MSSSDVATSPVRRRHAAARRAQAEPYTRRSERRARNEASRNDDDHENELQLHRQKRSLFSRLISFIPFVGNREENDEEQLDSSDDMATTPVEEEEEEEQDEDETTTEKGTEENGTEVTSEKENVASPRNHKAAEHTPTSPVRTDEPALLNVVVKKRTSPSNKITLGNGGESAKLLKIAEDDNSAAGFAFRRTSTTGRRRSKPSSPGGTSVANEAALTVIKQRKPISFEEYEQLSSQLRSLVEPTPENALALTRNALTTALSEGRVSTENGVAKRWTEQSVAALPSSKRSRPNPEAIPLTLAVSNMRDDRLTRKPRPSRLLTGPKRDAASRSAYSAAVAEKILSTLNKIQTPLDREVQKPTPSTSLSWAKYHLAATRNDKETADAEMRDTMSDEEMPPNTSIPTIPSKSAVQVSAKQPSTPVSMSWAPKATETPAKPKSTVDANSLFSTPSISMTPASMTTAPPAVSSKPKTSSLSEVKSVGQYSFSLPPPSEWNNELNHIDHEDVQYFFSPPPALREPPVRAPGQRKTAKVGVAAPFAFAPSSPKSRTEGTTKSTPMEPRSKTNESAKSATPASQPVGAGVNPLARFLKMEEGSWRCPSCSVTNGAKFAKCPCCETEKPVVKQTSPTTAPAVPTASASNPLARFMKLAEGSWRCPTCAVANEAKYSKCPCCETDKPGGDATTTELTKSNTGPSTGSAGAGGFTFGAASTSASTTASKSSGFTFGSATNNVEKPASTVGFSFGAPVATGSETETKPLAPVVGFSFGATAVASKPVEPVPAFSFGAVAKPAMSTEGNDATRPPSFSFGSTKSSDSLAVSNKDAAVSEGVSASQKRKAEEPAEGSESKKSASTGFTFGGSTGSTGFSFGAPASGAATAEKTAPSAKVSFNSVGNESKDATADTSVASKKPSFGFGESVKPAASITFGALPSAQTAESKSTAGLDAKSTETALFSTSSEAQAPATHSFSFASSADSKPVASFGGFGSSLDAKKSTDSTPPKQPSFTFGQKPAEKSDASSGFTFGSSSSGASGGNKESASAGKTSLTFGAASDAKPESSQNNASFTFGKSSESDVGAHPAAKPSFTFGQSTTGAGADSGLATSSKPAFTFGQSGPSAATSNVDGESALPKPAFTFGQSTATSTASAAPASVSFGSSSASTTVPFTFGGSAATSSSAAPAAKPAAPSFSFGGASQTPSTSFGASASGFGQAPTTEKSGFGSTSGFGAAAPSPAPFGAPAATASASAPFGAAPSATPSFGATTTTTSATPAFSFGSTQSSAPSQPAFGFGGVSTSTAFNTPSTDVFGSTSTPAFGATSTGFGASAGNTFGGSSGGAFGASPSPSPAFGSSTAGNSGFGATQSTTFGASPPAFGAPNSTPAFGNPSPAFGAPNPAPSAGFGAPSATFGAPSPQFGAPAGTFGAPPAGAGGFGAPGGGAPFGGASDGSGFSMGQAPNTKRRILKAKSRSKSNTGR